MEAFKKEYLDDIYQSALITATAVGISMLSDKVIDQPLGAPASLKGTAKLLVAVTLSTIIVVAVQEKKIFKSVFS